LRVWVFVALSGCNWVYGLDETRIRDGGTTQFFDAPADAAFGCPLDGSEPLFKLALRQVPVANCYAYVPSFDSGKALAQCGPFELAQGTVDAPMQRLDVGDGSLSDPRLFPEGDLAFAKSPFQSSLRLLSRAGDVWTDEREVLPIPAGDWHISNPTSGPDRRAIVIRFDSTQMERQIIEYAEVNGTWTPRDTYQLATPFGYRPSLTSDGLHLVFDAATAGIYYAARANRDARFSVVTKLSTAPQQGLFPFLTDDCGSLYFSALDTVFVLQQR
jgi:hypothetical protein